MRKRTYGVPLVGGSSLLVIFAVLCLTVFALLTLSTVEAGGRLSQKSAAAVTAYYEADCKAQEVLAKLRSGGEPEGVTAENGVLRYTIPITEGQELRVLLQRDAVGTYRVLEWKAAASGAWTPDMTLRVWDGETP